MHVAKLNEQNQNASKKDEITCINLPKALRDRLAEKGNKKDTYADIITRMLDSPCGSNTDGQESDENEE